MDEHASAVNGVNGECSALDQSREVGLEFFAYDLCLFVSPVMICSHLFCWFCLVLICFTCYDLLTVCSSRQWIGMPARLLWRTTRYLFPQFHLFQSRSGRMFVWSVMSEW